MAQNSIYNPWKGTKGPRLCLVTKLPQLCLVTKLSLFCPIWQISFASAFSYFPDFALAKVFLQGKGLRGARTVGSCSTSLWDDKVTVWWDEVMWMDRWYEIALSCYWSSDYPVGGSLSHDKMDVMKKMIVRLSSRDRASLCKISSCYTVQCAI